MRKSTLVCLLAALVAFGTFALASDTAPVTLEGKITCAKCSLGMADAKECQNVLVVDQGGTPAHYYIAKNDISEAYGHTCKGEKAAVVTGTVAEKDGKKWITATKMEAPTEKKA